MFRLSHLNLVKTLFSPPNVLMNWLFLVKCQQEPKGAALLINLLSYNNGINGCFKYPQEWAVPENIYTPPWMALEKSWLSSRTFSAG